MAQQDTGLGWNAEAGFLISTPDLLGNLSDFDTITFPGQPLPIASANTANAVVGAGFRAGTEARRRNAEERYYAVSPDTPNPVAAFVTYIGPNSVVSGSHDYNIYFVSPVSGTKVIRGNRDIDRGTISGYASYPLTTQSTDFPGLYYTSAAMSVFPRPLNSLVPEFADVASGLAAINFSSSPVYKLNNGYAVRALVMFYNSAGDVISTPVLISTALGAYDISYDLTDPASDQALSTHLYQGRYFAMSYLPQSTASWAETSSTVYDMRQFGAMTEDRLFAFIASSSYANIQVTNAPDPYQEEGNESGEEGGGGEELEDDPVEEETLPLPSVAGHGFCTIYVPSSQELSQMASYLWSGSFDVSQVLKLFSNPMDSILGLSAVPVSLTGSPEQIYLGGVALTGITMPKYTGRTSVKVDFGTVTIAERWGSYLDYAPYTDFSIYLPFIGIKPIKADDIMGKTISLMYAIDILSGGCVAYLRPVGGSVLYEWSGQCAVQIPVTGRSYDNVFQSAMSVATATLAAVTAPASAPVLSGAVASAAVQAAASKPHIERSGTVNGITGFLGQLRPYLIRTIPEAYIPADQNKFIGYPAYINVDLASVMGYNEVDSIHLENVPATGAELEEIETILKGGVIF